MNCVYLKQKIDRTMYCKKQNKSITFKECSSCEYKEFKGIKHPSINVKKNKNIAKLERNRFSILTNDLTKCIICGNKKEHLHEVFPGRNRSNSMKYGCVIPLCSNHHREIHNDTELATYYKILAQQRFNEVYPYLNFVDVFKRNYLYTFRVYK